MAAKWKKNQTVAAQRNCDLIILNASGEPASPGTDFMAAGAVLISGATAPKCAVALGTMTNKRRPLVVADDVVETVTGNDLTLTAHAYQTGDGPFTSDEAMGTILAGTEFWIIKNSGANSISIASTLANAYAGTKTVLTGTEVGATISDKTTTERGIWGLFTYQATQTETDHDNPETAVIVDGTVGGVDYLRMNGGGAYTTVIMDTDAALLDEVLENGHTVADALRASLRTHAANFTREAVAGGGTKITFRNLADTKNSHHGTLTDAGRINSAVDDLT